MDLLHSKSDQEILRSVLAEVAKTANEVKCAKQDLEKATNRLSFLIVLANEMLDRQGD